MIVNRDENFIKDTVSKLTQFYINTYLPYLLDQQVYVPIEIMDSVDRL